MRISGCEALSTGSDAEAFGVLNRLKKGISRPGPVNSLPSCTDMICHVRGEDPVELSLA